MNTIGKIRAEIERRIESCDATSKTPNQLLWAELSALLPFLDTLEEPEQPTRGYDEAYLNEKIAKASKSWKGVDVDKFMDEIRGREQSVSDCHDLEEAAEKFARFYDQGTCDGIAQDSFKAGAQWQYQKDRYEFAKLKAKEWSDGYNEGIVRGKEQMMKDAVKAEVYKFGEIVYVKECNNAELAKYLSQFNNGDKVKIIAIHETDIR